MRSRAVAPLFGAAFILFAVSSAAAQEPSGEILSALKDRAVVLDIVARVVEREASEVWNKTSSRVTIPGRPVSLKLVGTNVVVLVQFTPYKREDGRQVLVAQGQVWVETKDAGMRYQTTMETIPIDFGERVYYFPLGPHKGNNDARIEIQIELKRYQGEPFTPDGSPEDAKPAVQPKTPAETPPSTESKVGGETKKSAKDAAKALVTEDDFPTAVPRATSKNGAEELLRRQDSQSGEERLGE